jgi:hypothetical protein
LRDVESRLVVVQRATTRVEHLPTEPGHIDDDCGVRERVELNQAIERAVDGIDP